MGKDKDYFLLGRGPVASGKFVSVSEKTHKWLPQGTVQIVFLQILASATVVLDPSVDPRNLFPSWLPWALPNGLVIIVVPE